MSEQERIVERVSLDEFTGEEISLIHRTDELKNIKLDSPVAKKILKHYTPPEGFDKVGFARPLGGLFYVYFYAIAGGIVILLTFSQLLKVLYPFPDSKAYSGLGGVLFGFLFFVDKYFPDFSKEDLHKVIEEFKQRQRRFGK